MSGAAAGLIAAWLGAGLAVQAVLFAVVSAAALAVTRPLVRRYTAGKAVPTNLDRVLGDYLNPAPFDPGACTRGLYLRGID